MFFPVVSWNCFRLGHSKACCVGIKRHSSYIKHESVLKFSAKSCAQSIHHSGPFRPGRSVSLFTTIASSQAVGMMHTVSLSKVIWRVIRSALISKIISQGVPKRTAFPILLELLSYQLQQRSYQQEPLLIHGTRKCLQRAKSWDDHAVRLSLCRLAWPTRLVQI
jgi:hypothetical protein